MRAECRTVCIRATIQVASPPAIAVGKYLNLIVIQSPARVFNPVNAASKIFGIIAFLKWLFLYAGPVTSKYALI